MFTNILWNTYKQKISIGCLSGFISPIFYIERLEVQQYFFIDSRCGRGVVPRLLRFRGSLHALARAADSRWSHEELHVSSQECEGAADRRAADGRARDVRILGRPLQGAPCWLDAGESRCRVRLLAEEVCYCKLFVTPKI